MKVWILQNQMRTEKQMRAAALRHRIFFFFFFSVIHEVWFEPNLIIDNTWTFIYLCSQRSWEHVWFSGKVQES